MDQAQIAQILTEKIPGALAEAQEPKAIVINREALINVAYFLKGPDLDFANLHCIAGVDRKDHMEVVYMFYSFKLRFMLTLKVKLPANDLTVETLSNIWRSADWLERETYDFFGIKFLNHKDLRRILNPDEWTYFPLRKDFEHPDFFRLPQTDGLKPG